MDKKDAKDLLVLTNSYNLEPVTILHPHLHNYKIVITKIKDLMKIEFFDPHDSIHRGSEVKYYHPGGKSGQPRFDDASEEIEVFLER